MNRVIVAGGGASGMLAAIMAAGNGAFVTLLEGGKKPGKKLLMTGNGRCNLTNLHMDVKECYRGAPPQFTAGILEQFSVRETLGFFREIGLLTCDREGYVYPLTNQAASVLDVLLAELSRLAVRVKCGEKITGIRKEDGIFQVQTEGWEYQAEAVILCCGSRAVPQTGSDGSGYALAKSLGHRILPPLEALSPLTVRETWVRRLAGLRIQADISLLCCKKVPAAGKDGARTKENGLTVRPEDICGIYHEHGELQFTEYGLSGIPVFQLSRYALGALASGGSALALIDLLPSMEKEELAAFLQRQLYRYREKAQEGRRPVQTCAQLLTGILPEKAIGPVLQQAGILPALGAQRLTQGQIEKIICAAKEMPFHITGAKGFERAQVCSGGVDTSQVDAQTLESKLVPGLYFAGELLDVDGICGGYNLQWAWSSGAVAGTAAAKHTTEGGTHAPHPAVKTSHNLH